MCQSCLNSDNSKRKFRLFDINPIPIIAPFKSRRCFDTLLESETSSDVLLKSKMSPNTTLELKKSSSSSSSNSVVNNSSDNFAAVTNEIRELLYAYQLLHLRTVLFLEGIHIKGIIMNVSQNLVTVIGPNVEVTSNSTGNIIAFPNSINVRLESIQAIGDVE
ncbi:hypothetical protein [Bacillus cereus]|uniref:hypothetical protein n=1 Tax=Bacillus cereus TaxID=1396 RepID=UPI000BF7E8B0|nr:hypothetical protein [Bacillus cereus]PFD14002.1 hypothetical protein CN295_05030 [Bacillus cereus]PFD39055.1 hypothetical protein CN281_30390 [Bacillus cereus]PFH91852.1 hypothetical protein COI78_20535 [Bacillus cereus]